MGVLTKFVEGKLGRNIIPMGRPETQKDYPANTKVSEVVKDSGMSPDRVDVIADGEDMGLNEEIGDKKDFTIMPKQKGGSFDFSEEAATLFIGYLLDPDEKDTEMWNKIEKHLERC